MVNDSECIYNLSFTDGEFLPSTIEKGKVHKERNGVLLKIEVIVRRELSNSLTPGCHA